MRADSSRETLEIGSPLKRKPSVASHCRIPRAKTILLTSLPTPGCRCHSKCPCTASPSSRQTQVQRHQRLRAATKLKTSVAKHVCPFFSRSKRPLQQLFLHFHSTFSEGLCSPPSPAVEKGASSRPKILFEKQRTGAPTTLAQHEARVWRPTHCADTDAERYLNTTGCQDSS